MDWLPGALPAALVLAACSFDTSGTPGSGADALVPRADCPTGAGELNGSCYWLGAQDADFFAARCQNDAAGAHLVVITSQQENDFIAALSLGDPTWIGLSRPGPFAELVWVDGTPLVFTHWDPGEPDGDRSCVEMRDDNIVGGWDDKACNEVKQYACELDP